MDVLAKYIERLVSIHKSSMRKFAQENSLQMVHIEVIQYLSVCNRYSNTTQALSEYLGQTKGSLSQTLKFLETNDYIKRSQDKKDRRIFHLSLTKVGLEISKNLQTFLDLDNLGHDEEIEMFKNTLYRLQKKNNMLGFGICSTCKYNVPVDGTKFKCALTGEFLSKPEVSQICREHEAI